MVPEVLLEVLETPKKLDHETQILATAPLENEHYQEFPSHQPASWWSSGHAESWMLRFVLIETYGLLVGSRHPPLALNPLQ